MEGKHIFVHHMGHFHFCFSELPFTSVPICLLNSLPSSYDVWEPFVVKT